MTRRVRLGVLFVVMVGLMFMISGCGATDGVEQGATGSTVAKPATDDGRDSALVAYESAKAALDEVASGGLLLSVGTQGVALADLPSTWSFIFLVPDTGHLWRVVVDHGNAAAPEDLGRSRVPIDASTVLDLNVVSVWAEQAITMARAVAAGTSEVPPNVMIMGGFMEIPGVEGGDSVYSVWKIAFTQGSSMQGAREFTVNMVDGQILEVTE